MNGGTIKSLWGFTTYKRLLGWLSSLLYVLVHSQWPLNLSNVLHGGAGSLIRHALHHLCVCVCACNSCVCVIPSFVCVIPSSMLVICVCLCDRLSVYGALFIFLICIWVVTDCHPWVSGWWLGSHCGHSFINGICPSFYESSSMRY